MARKSRATLKLSTHDAPFRAPPTGPVKAPTWVPDPAAAPLPKPSEWPDDVKLAAMSIITRGGRTFADWCGTWKNSSTWTPETAPPEPYWMALRLFAWEILGRVVAPSDRQALEAALDVLRDPAKRVVLGPKGKWTVVPASLVPGGAR